jgi:hypothetical protein
MRAAASRSILAGTHSALRTRRPRIVAVGDVGAPRSPRPSNLGSLGR